MYPISSPESLSGPSSSSLYWFRIGASRLFFTIVPIVAR